MCACMCVCVSYIYIRGIRAVSGAAAEGVWQGKYDTSGCGGGSLTLAVHSFFVVVGIRVHFSTVNGTRKP